MSSSYPELPEDISNLRTFPYPESNHFEYKAGLTSCALEKVYETICGLLNVGGGYMIFGIDDRTLNVNGVYNSTKEIDRFILKIDNIYHHGIILTSEGDRLVDTNVTVREIKLSFNPKSIIVITVKPVPYTSYKLKNNTVIYRVNASNLSLGRKKYVTDEHRRQRDYQASQSMRTQYINSQRQIEQKTQRATYILERRIEELEEQKEELEEQNKKLENTIRKMRSNMSWGEWLRSFFY